MVVLCFWCSKCTLKSDSLFKWLSDCLLTHITLLGEPMDEPGGEMEVSDRRLCCELQSDVGKWTEEKSHTKEISTLFLDHIDTFFSTPAHPESPLCPCCLLA